MKTVIRHEGRADCAVRLVPQAVERMAGRDWAPCQRIRGGARPAQDREGPVGQDGGGAMRTMEIKAVRALRAYVAHMGKREWAEAEIMLRRLRGILERVGRDAALREVATW